jgi:hypothetical protein
MFEPRSYLEKLADVWVYPRFLNEAAATQDACLRMKLVITWFVAGELRETSLPEPPVWCKPSDLLAVFVQSSFFTYCPFTCCPFTAHALAAMHMLKCTATFALAHYLAVACDSQS